MRPEKKSARSVEPVENWLRQRLRDIRLAKDISQREIGVAMGYGATQNPSSRVSDLENDKSANVYLSTYLRYIKALGITLGEALRGCPEFYGPKSPVVVISPEGLKSILTLYGVPEKKASEIVKAASDFGNQ